jgi:hypothetical protein
VAGFGKVDAKGNSLAPHLLIDGDIFAFKAAAACQYVYEDPFGYLYPVAHKIEGEAVVDNLMSAITKVDFPGSTFTVVLSDPKDNWRKDVWADYKAVRKVNERPLLLDILKDYLREKYGAFHWDRLEADDVLGILATIPPNRRPAGPENTRLPGTHVVGTNTPVFLPQAERIIVGRDKDFLTIPGKYHRLGDYGPGRKPVVTETTPWQAKRWHMMQTLAGDRVDGYPGCRGIGMDRAADIIDDPKFLRPEWGVITRGINKGQSVQKWVAEPTNDYWRCIVSHYAKAGHEYPERDAWVTARLAHILQWGDYEDGNVVTWDPERLEGLTQ